MRFPDIKDTIHEYRGYTIKGTTRRTEGGWVLGGRHFIEGGIARNYEVWKDGRPVFKRGNIIERLKHAKEQVDNFIERQNK